MNDPDRPIELTPEEHGIERQADKMVPVSPEKRKQIESILDKACKSKTICPRLSQQDLEMAKQRAAREGLPHQTLISSVIHKYVTGQFVETAEVRKAIGPRGANDAM